MSIPVVIHEGPIDKALNIESILDDILSWVQQCSRCQFDPAELRIPYKRSNGSRCIHKHMQDLLSCALVSKSWMHFGLLHLWGWYGQIEDLLDLMYGSPDKSRNVFEVCQKHG